ncbi:hypothetical protein MTR67_048325 [Solanum verrucosum]|uniref:GPI ethanolamine phosphate transferase 1 n=1 Tax=Solanum verrucosum TaxID=315347 RepID=A0AAF0UY63_SOLVR|nr:hypothetical protein MTR67_048325 [Solanum verrucosum]
MHYKVGHVPLSFSSSISIDQQLRLLELNSWQLLRHLEVHLPGLVCENFLCNDFRDDGSEKTRGYSSLEETFCCLYMKAADLHVFTELGNLGKRKCELLFGETANSCVVFFSYLCRSACEDNCHNTLVAYHNFLRSASKRHCPSRSKCELLMEFIPQVKDIVQVDQNVSQHLVDERSRADWTLESSATRRRVATAGFLSYNVALSLFRILHYLGLDHVGHLGGRNSMSMAPKLGEMDEVIKTIDLNSLSTNNNDQGRTLLLVVSDHGMTETGNHGRIII